MLVQTKLSPPPLPDGLLPRQLQSRLDQCLEHRLTLLTGPAGFGKTSLLVQWLPSAPCAVAWLTLDQWDNEPQAFWSAVVAALQTASPQLGLVTQSYLSLPELPRPTTYLAPLIHDLQALTAPLLLVLDDFQAIEQPAIDEALAFLLAHAPAQFQLLISSRSLSKDVSKALSLTRLRGRQQLLEITPAELRLQTAEIAALATQHGLTLDPQTLAQLEQVTEGWPLCVQLLLRSASSAEAPAAWEQALANSQQDLMDYLWAEVFAELSSELQTFLSQLVVLETFDPALCVWMTGRSDSGLLLHQLEAQQVFVLALDQAKTRFRLHPLLAELLSARLQQNPAQWRALQQQAMHWFAQQSQLEPAIAHGLKAQAYADVTALIHQQAYAMLAQGKIVQLGRWLSQLPEPVLQASAELQLFEIWVLILSQQLERAQARLAQLPDTPELRPQRENLLATLARKQGRPQQVISHSQQALALPLDTYSPFEQDFIQGTAWFNLGIGHLMAQASEPSLQAFETSLPFQHRIQNLLPALAARVCQARIYLHQGQLEQAGFLYQQALQDAEQWHLGKHSIVGTVWLDQALTAYHRGDAPNCLKLTAQGVAQTAGAYNLDSAYGFKLALELYCRLKAWEQAADCLQQAEQFGRQHQYTGFLAELDTFRCWLWLGRQQAELLANRFQQHSFQSPLEGLVAVRYLLQAGKHQRAADLLTELTQQAQSQQQPFLQLELCLLQAISQAQQAPRSQQAAGSELFTQALALAMPRGLLGIWLELASELKPFQALLKTLSTAQQAFCSRIWPELAVPEVLAEALSPREIELLQLMAQGFSNQALAEHLVVSVNTIKTHLKNLFRKLEVSSRTQALARAHHLGLLESTAE